MNNVSRKSLKKILLVEDNYKDAELTLLALTANNLANEIVSVSDGVEALDYLHCEGRFAGRSDGNPLVVFLDLKMPKLDGLEVLRRMKSDEKLRMIPVVMLTSSREENDLVTCYRLGVNAYVVKPVDFQQFVQAVKQSGMFWAAINEPIP